MSELTSTLPAGETQFYDNDLPGIGAGNFEISVTQSMPNAATSNFAQTITQAFVVQGPQFTLDPSEVHAQFPPANANGDFSLTLPTAILENPALPWERAITSAPETPWLALLVFSTKEIEIDPTTNSPLITGSVANFLKSVPHILKPAIDPSTLSDTVLSSSMNSIRISTQVFEAVTPRLGELASLTHVRQVNPEGQIVSGPADNAWYSVVVANRFPNSPASEDNLGSVNYVHLVSLEGLTEFLVSDPAWPSHTKKVELASLASWRFVSVSQQGETFAGLATALISSAGGDPNSLRLRIPVTDNGSDAATRLLDGYTALSYHTYPGPDTFAWYRGPFTPSPAQPLPSSVPAWVHASQAMIYDQANAVFDNSYAAAWTIGRLIALADPVFVASIQQVRTQTLATANVMLQRSLLAHLAGVTDMAELAAPGLTRGVFLNHVRTGLGDALTETLAKRPETPSAQPPSAMRSSLFPDEDPPAAPADQLRWFLRKPGVSSFLVEQSSEDLGPLALWLAKLVLLYNVPFSHLVPDQRMLPAESVRFFYIDAGWLKVLADAAMTVAAHGSKDLEVQNLLSDSLWAQTQLSVSTVRPNLLQLDVEPAPVLPAAGMLLRSDLVSGWPGLVVTATAGGTTVPALRIDRLSASVLLALWASVPDTISISQPQQSSAFGVDDGWTIQLRSLASDVGVETGASFPSTGTIQNYMRPATGAIGGRVLSLIDQSATGGGLIPALSAALGQSSNLTPSEFAIEMLLAPEQIVFNPPA